MLQSINYLLKKILPKSLKVKIKSIILSSKIKKVQVMHQKALDQIQGKERIKVVFLLIHDSCWKYDGVYHLMEKDARFEPIVVICPFITYGEEHMLRMLQQSYETFKNEGYNVINTFDKISGTWLDVKKTIQPDIVCFTNPNALTRPEYLIFNFLENLSCYVPYGFKNSYIFHADYNRPFQNFVWKFFLETDIHKKLAQHYAQNKGVNTLVTGYPGMDKLLQNDYKPLDVWKIKVKKVKRIIWAPHHTIEGMGETLDYATFFSYAETMFEIADKFQENIQIAFKPHPLLRLKLSTPEVWGKEKTDQYYDDWDKLPNGQLNEGDYIDLFLTSDGMIHDGSSFVFEYLYTNKPVMFLFHDDAISDRFSELGKMALEKHYHGKTRIEIEEFLEKVIIDDSDSMQNDRIRFFNTIVKPPNNLTASENIFNYLKSVIFYSKD